ncbi:MAG: polymorphic toxin-type HINT domain-containing protein [Oscillospiraceae bacterium]|nr:polymorphic toxin-type HINT domain-containing protein [Oscillospiraceae bacterium]
MNTTPKHGLINRLIAMLLVLTMTCVYVVRDNYAPIISEQSKPKSTDLLAQTLSYSTGLSPDTELRDVSDLVLAENTTNMGKASQSLSEAFAKMPENVKSSEELDKSVADFSKQIAGLKAQAIDELSETDNGSTGFSEYRDTVISGFNEVEELLSTVSVENYEMVMSEISALINPEKPYVSLADDLPFNDASEENITYSTYNPESVTDYQIDDGSYSSDDLRQTNDTIVNDDVRTEFADLESVLEVYQYVKNNYMMEFYFGSRKGAVGASAEKAGNDYDIASLLIGVLRDRNIPARYAKSEIEITAEQAMEWTATDDINVAIRSIAALGIPTTGMISDGETVAVRLEHTWVEAYVPYTDYRGTGNRSGERLWIPLDASFKKSTHLDGADIETINAYMKDESNYLNENSVINGVSVSNIAKMVDGEESAFVKYMLENGYDSVAQVFGGKEIIYEDLGYLPLSLPYNTVSDTERYDDIPIDYTDTINFELFGNSASGNNIYGDDFINETIYAPDVYGKRLTLTYVPATQADSEVISEYGGIFSTPAYLIKMKPQFVIDGEVIAEGGVCNTGYTQKYIITLSNKASSQNNSEITNNVIVGGMYSIVLDYGNVSEVELKNVKSVVDNFSSIMTEDNCYTETYMGELLYAIGKLYFSQLDIFNGVVAGVHNVTATRSLSLGIIGFNANVTYSFGVPSELKEGGVFLDIGHDVHCVVSNDNNNESEKKFMLEAGMYASAMEHGILEQVTGVESVSTIKALQYAQQNAVPIHYITKDNLDSEVAQLTFSDQLISDIRSSVNSGKVIIIPEHEITIHQWSGVGYMVLDPDTFACGYMISGGMAGGAMAWYEVLWETAKATVTGIFVGLCIAFWVWLFPVLLVPAIIAGIVCYGFLLYSIGSHMYNAVLYDDVREFQEAMIETSSFMLTTAFFLGLSEWLDIDYYEESGGEGSGEGGTEGQTPDGEGTGGKSPAEQANEEAGKAKGEACFIAGTLVATSSGYTQIEFIKAGDTVKSFDPITMKVSNQVVEETFIRQINELINIYVNDEIITTTPDHPFYVAKKGFVNAIELKAGDLLITVNGEYAVITMIQHEILESPVDVFNFRVANNHTYYVSNLGIGVHNNDCADPNIPATKPKFNATEKFKLHLKKGDGTYSRSNGIDGAHNEAEFLNRINDLHGEIIEETGYPDGLTEYKYKMYRMDKAAKPDLNAGQYDEIYTKTTYNPDVISDETFLNRALDVLNSDTLKIEGRKITGYEESTGLTWEGYLEKAGSTDVKTFYPLLS